MPPDTLELQTIVVDTVSADTLNGADEAPEPEPEEEPSFITVWEYENLHGFTTQQTDSTLRWVNALSLTHLYSRHPDAITYRVGTLGRMDGIDYRTYENRHFEAEMDGMRIADPLTGAVNWNRVPTHKIISMADSDYGPVYRTDIRLRDHYLVQPRTYLNFDEGSYRYRNLEFSATHNINPETNIELSFWDRRDGIGYSRSQAEGSQVVFKGYHQLSNRWLLRAGYVNNSMEQDQSFGYVLEDPSLFPFNPFTAQPNQGAAFSEEGSKDFYMQTHFRADSSRSVETQFGIHYQSDERSAQFNVDTVATDFRNVELFARQKLGNEQMGLTATARPFFLENRTDQLTRSRWLGIRGELDGEVSTGGFTISAHGGGTYRDDSQYDFYSGTRLRWSPFRDFSLSVFGGYSNRMQDIQALYWQSNTFAGNADLQNEQSLTAGVETRIGLGRYFSVIGRADIRETENAAFVALDSDTEGSFVTIDPYTSLSAMGQLNLESTLFEGMASATYKSFESVGSSNPINQGLHASGDRVWLKGNFYWKNYLFNRATFVKAGIIGMYSPNFMRTAEYIVPLNRWQHGTQPLLNPPYSRVDIDVSARIRWFMLLIRWENVFDRVTQPGYFETPGYPMPEQRFIFGLRVLFTN